MSVLNVLPNLISTSNSAVAAEHGIEDVPEQGTLPTPEYVHSHVLSKFGTVYAGIRAPRFLGEEEASAETSASKAR